MIAAVVALVFTLDLQQRERMNEAWTASILGIVVFVALWMFGEG